MIWIRCLIVACLTAIAYVRLQGFTVDAVVRFAGGAAEEVIQVPPGPYRYLGRGHQAFVFVNDAGIVLKVFNERRFTLPWPLNWLRPRLAAQRAKKREATFASYRLAWELLSEETGLLALHFAPTEGIAPVAIENRAQVRLDLDLNNVPFVLQRQGAPFYSEIERGEMGLQESIDQLLAFVNRCADLGIVDGDRDVEINFGVLEGQLLLFDPGRLSRIPLDRQDARKVLLRKATRRFRRWLVAHHPESVAYLDEKIASVI